MRYLAVDYGLKRTGIAVSDPEGRMAFPRPRIDVMGKDRFFADLLALADTEGVEAFVVGLPLLQDGSDSETTRQVRNMAKRLTRRTALPVYCMPEMLSSFDAESRLRDAGKKGSAVQQALDSAAATAILESFLALANERRAALLLVSENPAPST